ncbi:YebC-like protein [Athelia psychrophila]|uniref:YebC-like protein n=1 Tax=Athelia psychrophila TaxID=1759441 RepID=A0A166JHZ4_9AGAM|nr:YebC-like protein [Fibularhizoctonia sp. CBS 109695]
MLPLKFLPPLRRSLCSSAVCLSGHNKWSKIKGKKAILDGQKSQIYGKAQRDILVAARNGGSIDPDMNATLAAALKAARAAGVPKDNIERAMNKAGGGKGQGCSLVTYEAARGSVGIIIEVLTDNNVRTLQSVRHILQENGAQFASVAFQFERKGYVKVALDHGDDFNDRVETLVETALEANAEDFEVIESADPAEVEFTCPPNMLAALASAVGVPASRGVLSSELIYTPLQESEPPDEELAASIGELVGELEEDEDTLRVWTTLDS